MLAGQVISLGDSVIISLTGILIVMLELAFLAVFIQVLSKVLAAVVKEKTVLKAPASGKSPGEPQPMAISPTEGLQEEDDLAVIMTVVLEETGFPAESIIFRSVTRMK